MYVSNQENIRGSTSPRSALINIHLIGLLILPTLFRNVLNPITKWSNVIQPKESTWQFAFYIEVTLSQKTLMQLFQKSRHHVWLTLWIGVLPDIRYVQYHYYWLTGQLLNAIEFQEILGHIFCLVAKSKLPTLGYIQPYQVWLWGQNWGCDGANKF